MRGALGCTGVDVAIQKDEGHGLSERDRAFLFRFTMVMFAASWFALLFLLTFSVVAMTYMRLAKGISAPPQVIIIIGSLASLVGTITVYCAKKLVT